MGGRVRQGFDRPLWEGSVSAYPVVWTSVQVPTLIPCNAIVVGFVIAGGE